MQSLPLSHHSLENHTTITEQSAALFFGGVAQGDPSGVPAVHTVFKKLRVAAIRDTVPSLQVSEPTSLICSMTMRGANTGRAFMITCSYSFPVYASVLCRSTSRLIINAVISTLSLLQSHVSQIPSLSAGDVTPVWSAGLPNTVTEHLSPLIHTHPTNAYKHNIETYCIMLRLCDVEY